MSIVEEKHWSLAQGYMFNEVVPHVKLGLFDHPFLDPLNRVPEIVPSLIFSLHCSPLKMMAGCIVCPAALPAAIMVMLLDFPWVMAYGRMSFVVRTFGGL